MDMIALYRAIDREIADLYYRLHASRKYEETPFVPAIETKEALETEFNALRSRVAALEEPDGRFTVLRSHFVSFLDSMAKTVTALYKSPSASLGAFMWKYESMDQDRRPQEEKDRVLMAVYSRLPEVWAGICTWLDTAAPAAKKGAAYALRSTADGIRHAEYNNADLRAAMDKAAGLMEQYAAILDDGSDTKADAPSARLTPDEYRDTLRRTYGIDPDDLMAWGETESELTRARCFELAADIAKDKGIEAPKTMNEVNDLLYKYAGPAATAEEMFERAGGYLKRTRALAHSVMPLPDDEECELTPVPWKLRYSYPWGGYSYGDRQHLPVQGRMFLNKYNVQAITDGWMKINALHEAYPGHHVQFVRMMTDTVPETLRIGAQNVPIMEGMCHRTEDVYSYVYTEDPFYPLFAAYRRHHTAVRIRVDLMLFRDGRPIEDAIALYREELGFDERTAGGQVQSHLDTPGYFTCYYYGMKKITQWEKEFGWERDAYTDLLFSMSTVSLDTFRKVLELTPEERASLLRDFA